MKIQGSKKTALIILVAFVLTSLVVLTIVLYSNFTKKYPKEPIQIENFGSTEQTINISSLNLETEIKDLPIYSIKPKVHILLVEQMIEKMGLSLKKNEIVPESYIEWSDGENIFTYDSQADSVTFELTRRISLERGENSFASLFEKYLGLNYKFRLINEKRNLDEGITYYASRLQADIPLQYAGGNEYSDILKFDKHGNLVSGLLLLAEIEEYDLYLPLISKNDLEKYINTSVYPKEYYLDTSILVDTLNLHYLDDEWENIEKTVNNCIAQESEIIFMYRSSTKGYLLPVFKISSRCTVTSNNQEYMTPAFFYVSAVDPKYVTL